MMTKIYRALASIKNINNNSDDKIEAGRENVSSAVSSKLPITEEAAATESVKSIFSDIQRVLELPFVPNIYKALATSPTVLAGTWAVHRNVFLNTSLPISLASMILFSISATRNCRYCSSIHKVNCKTLGVDETTLSALQGDLASLTPQRVHTVVQFAVQCALDTHGLKNEDYDAIRSLGLGDEELLEIISLAAMANYFDTLADGIKIDVDAPVAAALQE